MSDNRVVMGDDGSQGDRAVSGAVGAGSERLAAPDDSGAHAPGAGALVRHAVAGPGVDIGGHAEALDRDPHTIGRWASAFGEGGSKALIFEQTGGSPRP